MNLNIRLEHKVNKFKTEACVVDKIIELPSDEYAAFSNNILGDYPFIKESADLMKKKIGVNHCLLVLGEGYDDGIFIQTEGYEYAKCSAFVPMARQIMFMEQRYNCIQDLESCLIGAVDEVISCANDYNGKAPYRASVDDLMEQHRFEEREIPLLLEMLGEHSDIEVEMDNNEILIFTNRQQENIEKHESHRRISEEKLEIMCAKHFLWLHDQVGGEQADFSNMNLSDHDFMFKRLDEAIFRNTILYNVEMRDGSFTGCDFSYADFISANAYASIFDNSDFTGSKIKDSNFQRTSMTDCNFKDADFNNSEFNFAALDHSELARAITENANFTQTSMNNCTGVKFADSAEVESSGMEMV